MIHTSVVLRISLHLTNL